MLRVNFTRVRLCAMKRTRAPEPAKRARVDPIITQLMPSLVAGATVWADEGGASWAWMLNQNASALWR